MVRTFHMMQRKVRVFSLFLKVSKMFELTTLSGNEFQTVILLVWYNIAASGAGTNLKVGGTGPAQKWGAPIGCEVPEFFFGRAPSLFWLQKYN